MTPEFWRDRRVLLTGHTGFKGSWLALWLERLGARVSGVALPPATDPSLFDALAPWPNLVSIVGDLRQPGCAADALSESAAEIVFHLAAQALVRPSYVDPVGTFDTNVLGTVNLLEAVRRTPSVKAVVVVTSDKVYANNQSGQPFGEHDKLGGRDPYSASKACQEIVTASYRESFLAERGVRVGSARAGNVIGGGDWAVDRLIPDFVRAAGAGRPLVLRHPDATRPWQHVLDPLLGYLIYAERLHAGSDVSVAHNFGPPSDDVWPVHRVVERLARSWGDGIGWTADNAETVHEAQALTLDSARATRSLGWRPRLRLDDALHWTASWYCAYGDGRDMRAYSLEQLDRYEDIQ
jgi:CDP-glucose 4,6-dehydratase